MNNNSILWILIILLILGSSGNVFNSSVFSGCGLPILLALGYCLYRNGTLGNLFSNGCGCNSCNNG